ncbi:MAG: cyclic nucleotide-binding domain-containing protein, partial [Nocardiopsis sp. BM-2018]
MSEGSLTTPRAREPRRFARGDVLLFPGPPDGVWQLVEGLARIQTVDADGNGLTLRYVKPGEFFGEESLVGGRRGYFVEAVSPVTVTRWQVSELDETLRAALLEAFARTIPELYRALRRWSGKRLKARVAWELLALVDTPLASRDERGRSVVRSTHDDLAAAVGSVRETVTKLLGELQRGGALEAGYGKVTLIDPDALRAVADGEPVASRAPDGVPATPPAQKTVPMRKAKTPPRL